MCVRAIVCFFLIIFSFFKQKHVPLVIMAEVLNGKGECALIYKICLAFQHGQIRDCLILFFLCCLLQEGQKERKNTKDLLQNQINPPKKGN